MDNCFSPFNARQLDSWTCMVLKHGAMTKIIFINSIEAAVVKSAYMLLMILYGTQFIDHNNSHRQEP